MTKPLVNTPHALFVHVYASPSPRFLTLEVRLHHLPVRQSELHRRQRRSIYASRGPRAATLYADARQLLHVAHGEHDDLQRRHARHHPLRAVHEHLVAHLDALQLRAVRHHHRTRRPARPLAQLHRLQTRQAYASRTASARTAQREERCDGEGRHAQLDVLQHREAYRSAHAATTTSAEYELWHGSAVVVADAHLLHIHAVCTSRPPFTTTPHHELLHLAEFSALQRHTRHAEAAYISCPRTARTAHRQVLQGISQGVIQREAVEGAVFTSPHLSSLTNEANVGSSIQCIATREVHETDICW